MDFKAKSACEYFHIVEINKLDHYLVVEDKELGLAFTVRPKRIGWIKAEIFNRYSVKFYFDQNETEVVTFMT
jgi:hypothetical protein